MKKKPVIFCDFDGTITMTDNIVAIMKHFDPPGWKQLLKDFLDKKMTLRECVGAMFALFPSSMREEMTRFAIQNAVIRDGFVDFVQFCKQRDIELLITSGGIDFFLYPLLAPFDIPKSHIYCNSCSFEGFQVEILWPNACDAHCAADCGMCKTSIIRRYDPADYHRYLIGDSVSDFEGAKLADTIFARHDLIVKCEELGLSYFPYDTFYDIIDKLEAILPK